MAKITEKEDKYLKKLVEESYAEQKISEPPVLFNFCCFNVIT